jgi:Tfp pilus assembly protein FimT
MEDQKLAAAVESIYSDIRYARSESIKRSENFTVTFTEGASWNYVIADSGGTTIKTVSNTQFSVASVVSTFTSDIITFNYVRGTANAGTITVTTDDGSSATVTVSAIGRIKLDYL